MLPEIPKAVVAIVLLLILVGAGSTAHVLYKVNRNDGYAPEQPIPFSHKIHAGDNEIPCMYCHSNVTKSRHATVPAMNVCMNCHSVVKLDSPLIQKVRQTYDQDQAIEWVRVHDLPDFVFFNHKRHVAQGVACQTCHGDVAGMDKIEQVHPFSMGQCVNCHRDNDAPIECNTCHQ